ncbi:hypothetical protein [Roseicella sp. DB1501]|uniref:hypothetical protein n=1 Tax=Roseicella sp. DB1501 TaxID=2730925 RepID=UPI001492230A|nr:hypothetical protein [Roseicella sp. DB1501]NOG73726.1 hypothetical protein [Roseicella sp. DB1501]
MKVSVYHDTHPTFGLEKSEAPIEKVADLHLADATPVETALSHAFRLTNHVDEAWNDPAHHPDFLIPAPGPQRSTSVGDIVVVDAKRAFACARVGWVEIPFDVISRRMKGPQP